MSEKQRRSKPLQTFSLSPDAIDRLKEMARRLGMARSQVIERLIRDTEMPEDPGGSM